MAMALNKDIITNEGNMMNFYQYCPEKNSDFSPYDVGAVKANQIAQQIFSQKIPVA